MERKAYAKINLTLEVLARRDDGFHEIATVLQTVEPYLSVRVRLLLDQYSVVQIPVSRETRII